METDGVVTVGGLLDRAAARGTGDAIVFPEERLSFQELQARTLDLAARLVAAGLRNGDRLGILYRDGIDSLALMLAAARIGVVPVPVNARYKARELTRLLGHSGMQVFVVDAAFLDLVGGADIPASCRVIVGIDDEDFVARAADVSHDDVAARQMAVSPGDDALILYTSGTTADPKGCVYSQWGFVAQAFGLAEALELTSDDRYFTPLPLFHVSAIVTLAASLAAPCAFCHVGRRFEPGVALEVIERERCTVAFPAFETLWLGVLNHPRFAEADVSAMRLVINVGSPGSLVRMQEKFPTATQVSALGGTEFGGFVSIGRARDTLESRTTTGGKPLTGAEVRIVDPETGADAELGARGEILMRGHCRFVRYHDDPETTAERIDVDGWYHSGDLGRIDPDGSVTFVGRLKDMLKVGGENVAAAEIESFLMGHPAVEIVQVVGAPDARYIEVPAAFVQLRAHAEATEEELIDFCRGDIATFKVPRYVRFVTQWPMSGTKIQKFRLREEIAADLERRGITEAPKITSA